MAYRFAFGRFAVPLCLALLLTACGNADPPPFQVTMVPSPAGSHSGMAHLSVSPDGRVVLSWLEGDDEGKRLRYATTADGGWSAPRELASGTDWFVNWADFPSVTPISSSVWAAHWLVRRPGHTYSYDVAVSVSQDGGASWGPPVTPHTDGTATEHGFVSLFPWREQAAAVWLDGRNTATAAHDHHGAEGPPGAGMTLRSATIAGDGGLRDGSQIDDLVCDCCQTDVAITDGGPVVVYRDRTTKEIRDIHIARATEAGWEALGAVADDNWRIDGCPVNGPAVDARGADVAVAWFTAAGDRQAVRLARSANGGVDFADAVDIATDGPIGRVDVALLEDGSAVVSWLRRSGDGRAQLCLRRQREGAPPGPVRVVDEVADGRPTGFPQMVLQGDELVLAWTGADGEITTILTARIAADAI